MQAHAVAMELATWLTVERRLLWIHGAVERLFLSLVFQTVVMGNRIPMTSTTTTTTAATHHVTSGGGGGATAICPAGCFCSALSRIVYCSRRGLVEIPAGIPTDSVQLNMNGNQFRVPLLRRSNLSDLPLLEHLYLSECGIEAIGFGTFLDLPRLKWLDLSNNRLKTLTPRSFQGLDLLHLFLNGNRNLALDADSFEGLVTVGLYLHDCSLPWLRPEVLAPLSTSIKYLWLNGNELTTLDVRLEAIFKTVAHLRISSNPLHCNCRLSWLKTLFDGSGDIFKGAVAPSCLGPATLKGKFLNEVPASEFRCQAPAFKNIDAVFGLEDGRLDCRASGDPAPDLYWIKPSGWTTRHAAQERQDSQTNDASLSVSRSDLEQHLFGMYICLATNEAGNVTLAINVSWPIYHHHHHHGSSTTVTDLSRAAKTHGDAPPGLTVQDQTVTTPSDERDLVVEDKLNSDLPQEDRILPTTRPNYTLIRSSGSSSGGSGRHQETRMFSVLQMAFAVVGSHVCTLILCLATVSICYRSRWTRLKPRSGLTMDDQRVRFGGGSGGEKRRSQEATTTMPESPNVNSTGCSQFYLPDYFITSPK